MTDNETEIRELIERWAAAVHRGDMAAVLADHSDDIVMFDVPPPYEGIRGKPAYEQTWPPFFEWQARGSVFDILELTVVEGGDVAFAYALLRCDDEAGRADNPDQRLRLTLGLRKENGRWTVLHEHHSFADDSAGRAADGERDVRAVHDGWNAATTGKDLDGMMAGIADDVVSYEHQTPLQYVGVDAVRESCREGLEYGGDIDFTTPGLEVVVQGDLAVAWGPNHVVTDGAESWSRGTRVFRRRAGRWSMVHQHVSYPYDTETGQAVMDAKP